jgi:broad specificity phosphatase PhoE
LESKTYAAMHKHGVRDAWDLDQGSRLWSGESYNSVADRINDFLMTEWDYDSNIFVVFHGTPLLDALLTDTHTKHRVAPAGVAVLNGRGVVSTFVPIFCNHTEKRKD